MAVWQSLVLGLVQGLTEFLPVSSSAHLAFVPAIMRIPAPPLAFDVLLHLGTLAAVLWYFRRDLLGLMRDAWRGAGRARHILLLLVIGTIPAGLFGLFGRKLIGDLFNRPSVAAWQLLVTGLLLFITDRWRAGDRKLSELRAAEAGFVGVGQALSVLPGISRSGTTIAFGLWRGLGREEAARFSFLLAIPAILGAGLVEAKSLSAAAVAGSGFAYFVGFLTALVSGVLGIAFLLRHLRQGRLWPFAVYCWAAGIVFLVYLAVR